ncbi:MAG: glycosyltransferase family 2 protein [Bacteroidaceae bacterium]|nr:glycosyltransferase family 2 protein [Bacteroidaceae bacterium]
MLLSILIPTYNYDCTELVSALVKQAQRVKGLSYEIIVGDDGSTQKTIVAANRAINNMQGAVYWEAGCNSGRAAIRNRLYERSKGRWLLFLDSDGMPLNEDFLSSYYSFIKDGAIGVVCGGVAHPPVLPSPKVSLRWQHETTYEKRTTIEWRNRHPYANFRTFNFLIDRDSFSKVKFDEQVKEYGYEDNLFGKALQENCVVVKHIANPMMNVDIEANHIYLSKNEEALRTLAAHYESMGPLITIARGVEKIERNHLGWLLSLVYSLTRPLLKQNLLGASPRMWVFNLYRAGYLRSLLRKRVK